MHEELRAAQSLLKRGVKYNIPAPLFLRILGLRNIGITITQLYAGTELKMAAILTARGITDKKADETEPGKFMLEYYNDILTVVAIATLNRKYITKPALWLRKYLLRQLSAWQLLELYTMIRQFSGTKSFMSITRLAIATRITAPNLGPTTRGS
jgi:hypothetical protein